MRINTATLFLIPSVIWGSTFFAIKFQLGMVDPTWSVSYRFVLAGIILLTYSKIRRLNLSFSSKQHLFMLLQGIFLFGLNYWLVYVAEKELISALVAVAFSTIIFLNILFGTLFLRRKTEGKVYLGAFLGIVGTYLLFSNDLMGVSSEELPVVPLILCFASVVIASLGNITSVFNQSNALPVIQTNAFGMLYGGLFIGLIALMSGKSFAFDLSLAYTVSLLYLSIFGSIVAFGAYLTLIGKIGADKGAYVLIVIPVIAVVLSVFFENYLFTFQVLIGIALILGGNLIIIRKN
ncbi:MAG: EamA family transporter [Bacteroidota bacterium]